jgi:DNA polymerase-3 subunit epsilon
MRQIFLDTETTGLYADQGDRIIEIGCVELLNRKLTGNNLHFYLNPGRDSHEEALKVHGISNEFLRDKPPFAAIADELLEYVAGAEIIIHNAAFDLGFLNQELALLGRPAFRASVGNVVDTLVMAKEMFPGKRNSLDALCDRLGVDNSGRTLHGALLDAELLADVYINMTRGQEALLMDAATSHSDQAVARPPSISALLCCRCWPPMPRSSKPMPTCCASSTRRVAERPSGSRLAPDPVA